MVHSLLFIFSQLILIIASAMFTKIPLTATLSQPCGSLGVPMEYAQIHFHTDLSQVYIYGISTECYHCLYLPLDLANLHDADICIIIDTQHPYSIGYSQENPFSGCPAFNTTNTNTCAWQPDIWIIPPSPHHYNQYEHYSIHIQQTKATTTILKTSSNKHIPLYIALFIIFFMIISYNMYRIYLQKHNANVEQRITNNKNRIVSLDAFRGLSLIIMVFVNYGGGGYWWLKHSVWNGLTIADLVFPWFIFSMGFAMAIVFPKKLHKIALAQQESNVDLMVNNDTSKQITICSLLQKVMTRSIKLFIIGLFIINNAHDLEYMRIPGVLQYFAVSYCINSLIIIFTEPSKDLKVRCIPSIHNAYCPEIIIYLKQWLIILCILLVYLMIIFFIPFTIYNDKCPMGYFGPGGIGDGGTYIECTGGIHRYIDFKLFGENHVYGYPTCSGIYATGFYDPEGFMGSWTATILTFFGIFVARILTVYQTHRERIIRWFIICIIFGLIAGCLCGFKQNGGFIPINKNVWSLSFIMCQACTGTFILIISYILIDVSNIWSGLPFHWLGCNSIIIYTASEVFGGYFPWSFSYGIADHYKLLLSNLIGTALWILFAGYLFHKKIFYSL